MTSPVNPSMETQSPSLTSAPSTLKLRAGPVDVEGAAADDADLAHLPGHERGVAGHAALRREDALGGVHAADVVGAREVADQQDLLAALRPGHRVRGVEHHAAGGRAGAGGQALGLDPALLDGLQLVLRAEDRLQQLVELRRLDAHQRLLGRDQALVAMSTAMRMAARPVRLPLRVCSMKRRPCSMVNSKSCMSRSSCSSVWRTSMSWS